MTEVCFGKKGISVWFLYWVFCFLPMLLVVLQMKLFTLLLTYCITENRLGQQTGLLIFFI